MKPKDIVITSIINKAFSIPPAKVAATQLLEIGITEDDVKRLSIDDKYRIPVCNAMRDLTRLSKKE